MTRVILVEDDNDLRTMMVDELASEGLEVFGVATAIAFYQKMAEQDFDVAVLDIGLPDQSGLEIARYLRGKTDLGIVMLTAMGGQADRIAGYDAGADIYCVKPVSGRELSLAIVNLVRRMACDHCDVHDNPSVWRLDNVNWCLHSPCGGSTDLSAKEQQFIATLMASTDKPASRSEILSVLKYSDDDHGQHSLESLVLRLRKKIVANTSSPAPIKTVRGVGYQFSAQFSIF